MPQFLPDEPTLVDRLARAALVQKIGDVLASCRAPAVFGLHGDWGAGKTSFLHALHFYLTGDCPQCPHETELSVFRGQVNHVATPLWKDWKPKDNVAVVWFEAWRYQHEAAPIVALLHEIRAQLPLGAKTEAAAKKWFTVGIKSVLLGFDEVTKWIGFQAGKVVEQAEKQHGQWQKDHLAERLPSHTLREFLQQALKKLLPESDDARLVVLIDDLDRCDSQAAYKLLEGIKIYLNLPNCVFVLGVNQSVIEESLATQMKAGGDPRYQAREYLEKICKNFWDLPPQETFGGMIRELLNEARKDYPDAHPIAFEFVGSVAAVVDKYRCLPANPRKVKAFVNTLARFLARSDWNVADPKDTHELRPRLCVLFAYVYQFHPDMYRLLEADAWASKDPNTRNLFFDELLEWCSETLPKGKAGDKVHPVFDRVERVATPKPDPSDSNKMVLVPNFVDPARGNVFRAQGLVFDLKQTTVPRLLLAECLLR